VSASFSQGAEWKTLINKYIGTIPPSGDTPAVEHSTSADPRTPVSSAIVAKVGAAARCNPLTTLRAAALQRIALP